MISWVLKKNMLKKINEIYSISWLALTIITHVYYRLMVQKCSSCQGQTRGSWILETICVWFYEMSLSFCEKRLLWKSARPTTNTKVVVGRFGQLVDVDAQFKVELKLEGHETTERSGRRATMHIWKKTMKE